MPMEGYVEEDEQVYGESSEGRNGLAVYYGIRGLFLALFGVFILAKPMFTLKVVVFLAGLYLLGDGLFALYRAIRRRRGMPGGRGLLLRGAVSTLLGGLVVFLPGGAAELTGSILMYLLALQAIIAGVIDLRNSSGMPEGAGSGMYGGIMILMGVFLLLAPLFTMLLFVRLVGAAVLAGAVVQIGFAFLLARGGNGIRRVN